MKTTRYLLAVRINLTNLMLFLRKVLSERIKALDVRLCAMAIFWILDIPGWIVQERAHTILLVIFTYIMLSEPRISFPIKTL